MKTNFNEIVPRLPEELGNILRKEGNKNPLYNKHIYGGLHLAVVRHPFYLTLMGIVSVPPRSVYYENEILPIEIEGILKYRSYEASYVEQILECETLFQNSRWAFCFNFADAEDINPYIILNSCERKSNIKNQSYKDLLYVVNFLNELRENMELYSLKEGFKNERKSNM